ncbi:hypothetical protein [Thermincola potens]|uniref:Uncharacterized protein n=1 Tax=Thermincola potens (strain JR) TaxID=635013 RepID=D5X9L6_THEPJ|nr:hypothetical protein [Thermincola potens]ADG81087.1 conserved hypothetical protein [Thermincola potens JR]
MGLFTRLKRLVFRPGCSDNITEPSETSKDRAKVTLPCMQVSLERNYKSGVPHEVSIFVPRAEFRKVTEEAGKKTSWEVILNSITIVHAPRHTPLGGSPQQAKAKEKPTSQGG